ncbi:MAG: hypothetical protein FWH18_12630 [Marinilabiliaceae bacterium]|nr:hypothetical protein [Marinilabiliaceae bacterium]
MKQSEIEHIYLKIKDYKATDYIGDCIWYDRFISVFSMDYNPENKSFKEIRRFTKNWTIQKWFEFGFDKMIYRYIEDTHHAVEDDEA